MTRLIEAGDKIGPYEIVEDIPDSFVYKAVHQNKPGFFAVKFAKRDKTDFEKMLMNERRFLTDLSEHPNIVGLEDQGETEKFDMLFNVYRFINAIPARYLTSGNLDIVTCVSIALDVANACAYAHSQKVIHRDIKPSNILVDEYSLNAKITDFGLAVYTDEVESDGLILGTPGYISPEQALAKHIDPRTDTYALGVSLYYILTGIKPIKGKSIIKILFDTASQGALHFMIPLRTLRPDAPPELEQALERMMAKESKDRPDMEEVVGWFNVIKEELA